MENQDRLFDKIKEASHNAENRDFPAMEKIWSRVEEKLDKKEDRRTISLWKKIAVAASLLLVLSLGFQLLKTDKVNSIENVVSNDSIKPIIEKSIIQKDNAVVSGASGIVSTSEANKILKNQIEQQESLAIIENKYSESEAIGDGYPIVSVQEMDNIAISTSGYQEEEDAMLQERNNQDNGSFKGKKAESNDIGGEGQYSIENKKSAPLVVLNGTAIAHKDESKRDKMMQEELPNLQPEKLESLIILDEPLYIIDGIYYSENDLFGKNPTSPYAPLNNQEIKTITILQDLEATSKYGERGRKGVVIITTKNGSPVLKK